MLRLDVCLLVSMLPLSAMGLAQDVYRWTDENGMVHYGTRPPAEAGERVLQLGPSQAEAVPDAAERVRKQQRLLESYQRERELKQAAEAKRAAQERRVSRLCSGLNQQWRKLSHPGPIYVRESDGQRRYISDGERRQQKSALAEDLREHCGGVPD